MKDQVKEIQDEFESSMDSWADIILNFEVKADEAGIIPGKMDDEVVMNTTILFRHVIFNVGFHKGKFNEQNAEEFGNELHLLIKKFTGIDTKHYYHDKGLNLN